MAIGEAGKRELRVLAAMAACFLLLYWLPVDSERFQRSLLAALSLARWYAREHVLLCLVPAFFIAGAISVFISQGAVLKYLGPRAPRPLAYGVAAVSGGILAVCSCTVLPLFAGIYKRGAGLGPAAAFLYSGPAINVLAIVLTAQVLGFELGMARAVGAVVFSVVIGLGMVALCPKEPEEEAPAAVVDSEEEEGRPLWKTAAQFAAMVGILVFANWGQPGDDAGVLTTIYAYKWILTAAFGVVFTVFLVAWYGVKAWQGALAGALVLGLAWGFPGHPAVPFVAAVAALVVVSLRGGGEMGDWLESSWDFAKQILPLLFAGVLLAGLFLGEPGSEGLIPSEWVVGLLGGESLGANLFASVAGALMYFATLTEIPILEGLIDKGMGKGPALALLLAGPALSLPNMLVIRSVLGTKKTLIYVALVVVMSTVAGLLYGRLFA